MSENRLAIHAGIERVVQGKHLSEEEAAAAMAVIMDGQATPAQIAAFLTGLRAKGETVAEIVGLARTMRARAIPFSSRRVGMVDTCGTGGDGAGTFNISTTAAFVVAGAGIPVAKHGNRSVSSRCGSADVLENLAVRVDMTPADAQRCLDEVGICFLFAPTFHGAMKHVAGPRKEIGIRTVFNILGPLSNPAGASAQLVGVYDPSLTGLLAEVLGELGSLHALVVHGQGLDEATTTGVNVISELRHGRVRSYTLDPGKLGLPRASKEDLLGGDAVQNAATTREVLEGRLGPARDVVLLNAALALVAADAAPSVEAGLNLAACAVDSGAALQKLQQIVEFSRSCAA